MYKLSVVDWFSVETVYYYDSFVEALRAYKLHVMDLVVMSCGDRVVNIPLSYGFNY